MAQDIHIDTDDFREEKDEKEELLEVLLHTATHAYEPIHILGDVFTIVDVGKYINECMASHKHKKISCAIGGAVQGTVIEATEHLSFALISNSTIVSNTSEFGDYPSISNSINVFTSNWKEVCRFCSWSCGFSNRPCFC